MKSAQGNKPNTFHIWLTLWPWAELKTTEIAGKMVEVNGAHKLGRYDETWWKILHMVYPTLKCLPN